MNTYHFDFIGRERTAIGVTYPISAEVQAHTYDAAVLKLYDQWDHISVIHWSEYPDTRQRAGVISEALAGRVTL